jgi:hypothetical protein
LFLFVCFCLFIFYFFRKYEIVGISRMMID